MTDSAPATEFDNSHYYHFHVIKGGIQEEFIALSQEVARLEEEIALIDSGSIPVRLSNKLAVARDELEDSYETMLASHRVNMLHKGQAIKVEPDERRKKSFVSSPTSPRIAIARKNSNYEDVPKPYSSALFDGSRFVNVLYHDDMDAAVLEAQDWVALGEASA